MTEDRLALDFLGTFESLRMGPTFARGRRDERAGHVRELTISGSLVVALVRGPDDERAFRARVAVRSFGASEWARVEKALVAEARFTAGLLAGRMPAGIGAVFEAAGLSLVPLSLDEVAMDCSCERWPMPCVHLAAACYALARSFEEDPFGVFAWRGRGRDELLLRLRDLRGATALEPPARRGSGGFENDAAGGSGGPVVAGAAAGPVGAESAVSGAESAVSGAEGGLGAGAASEPVPGAGAVPGAEGSSGVDSGDEVRAFWGVEDVRGAPSGERPGSVARPDALLDQLDPPPLAHDGRPIIDLLRAAYRVLPEE